MFSKLKITNTNVKILIQTAYELNLNVKIISNNPLKIKLSSKNKSHIISEKSLGINTSLKAKKISKNKSLTLKTLAGAGLPVPKHITINKPTDYQKTCQKIPFPQAIKSIYGEKGKHVYLNINKFKNGQTAINQIFQYDNKGCIIESYHQGKDYRFLCLNNKLIGLCKRTPPTITGNGESTIKQLIQKENKYRLALNKKQGRRMLNRMHNWPRLAYNLNLQGSSLKAIPPQGKVVQLYPIPNFSTGGSVTTIDSTTIHPSLITLAEKVSKTIGLEICGIDMIIKSEGSELSEILVRNLKECRVIEINSDPGIRLHDWPNQGTPQNVAQKILKYIFNIQTSVNSHKR